MEYLVTIEATKPGFIFREKRQFSEVIDAATGKEAVEKVLAGLSEYLNESEMAELMSNTRIIDVKKI